MNDWTRHRTPADAPPNFDDNGGFEAHAYAAGWNAAVAAARADLPLFVLVEHGHVLALHKTAEGAAADYERRIGRVVEWHTSGSMTWSGPASIAPIKVQP